MPVSTRKYLLDTAISASRVVCQKIGDCLRRAEDSHGLTGDTPSPELIEVVRAVEAMWTRASDWLVWQRAHPPPDPTVTQWDWPEPQESVSAVRDVARMCRALADSLEDRAARWDVWNEGIAEFHRRRRRDEEAREEQGLVNRLTLTLAGDVDAQNEQILELRAQLESIPEHADRMAHLRERLDEADAEPPSPAPRQETATVESVLAAVAAVRGRTST